MPDKPGIGLALAGGGPQGAIYEIGALRAIEEALGIDLNDLDVYVGVSAGSFVASFLANGVTATDLARACVAPESGFRHPFQPGTFFRPAVEEFLRRGLMTPELVVGAAWDFATNRESRSISRSMARLGRAVPVGLFDNEPMRAYLEQTFSEDGRTDDFRRLGKRLFVVAADLDSGEAVRFGEVGWDHVPISVAVQASTALPALYPPVEIDGRFYLDGVLLKTLHASVGLDAGVGLLLCVNPIVPVDTKDAVDQGVMRRGRLVRRGLPTVLSQTFRTLVHSRLSAGLSSYEPRYPGQDFILFEPAVDDYRMFFTNIFTYGSRKAMCEHAYTTTRKQLLQRFDELEPVLTLHGLRLDRRRLANGPRTLAESVGAAPRAEGGLTERLDSALDRLEARLANGGGSG